MVQALTSRAFLGRMEYVKLSKVNIIEWITKTWKLIINYVPRVITLVNGWFYFHFLSKERLYEILSRFWVQAWVYGPL